jgi:hypothetical protein
MLWETRSWTLIGRIFRIVRTPITLLILLGVLLYGAWWGYNNVIAPVPPPAPDPCVTQTVAKGQLKSSQVTVSVYNGGDKKGLAADVGRSLRSKGFKVLRTSNTEENVQKTVIIGADAKSPEVLFVKLFFKDSVVRSDRRVDHSVDVLVGNKYAGFNTAGKTTYEVKSSTVCLPSQAATASPAIN